MFGLVLRNVLDSVFAFSPLEVGNMPSASDAPPESHKMLVSRRQWLVEGAATGEWPCGRSGHTAVCDDGGENMFVFGGYYDRRCVNDMYRLHIPTMTWTCLECRGDVPKGVASHTAVMDGSYMFVFGGSGFPFGHNNRRGLFLLNIQTLVWSQLHYTGKVPAARYGHSMSLSECKRYLYIYGGTSGHVFFDDCWRYCLRTREMIEMETHVLPMPRASIQAHQSLLSQPLRRRTEPQIIPTQRVTPRASTVRALNPDQPPPTYKHVCVVYGNKLYVLGGGSPDCQTETQLLVYALDFNTNTWSLVPALGESDVEDWDTESEGESERDTVPNSMQHMRFVGATILGVDPQNTDQINLPSVERLRRLLPGLLRWGLAYMRANETQIQAVLDGAELQLRPNGSIVLLQQQGDEWVENTALGALLVPETHINAHAHAHTRTHTHTHTAVAASAHLNTSTELHADTPHSSGDTSSPRGITHSSDGDTDMHELASTYNSTRDMDMGTSGHPALTAERATGRQPHADAPGTANGQESTAQQIDQQRVRGTESMRPELTTQQIQQQRLRGLAFIDRLVSMNAQAQQDPYRRTNPMSPMPPRAPEARGGVAQDHGQEHVQYNAASSADDGEHTQPDTHTPSHAHIQADNYAQQETSIQQRGEANLQDPDSDMFLTTDDSAEGLGVSSDSLLDSDGESDPDIDTATDTDGEDDRNGADMDAGGHVHDSWTGSVRVIETRPEGEVSSLYPSARRSHTCCVHKNKIYICGGTNGKDSYTDMWALNMDTLKWEKVKAKGLLPIFFHTHVITSAGQVLLYGGRQSARDETRVATVSHIWVDVPSLKALATMATSACSSKAA
ncbi:hypothetical protein SARC_03564 [Sphaeroforma arctica JP610]|uniref:Kelch domain-containing protein 10 n=1 Tax=Sphaeroforma arctica JP610 TaxID=667725 RepID=A0A0L0G7K3_9EUKA|nr:hypothetical protein SARC_03564 [Sphaeroforma arctica JP610]KNC84203.1 hypothetical protein SARC_03564 [Sphaeroforma arctica JP610]|eukprot:XP_014158105.1 hypothetical protein SARC_03564 [Sphaeroforma arctica JP610]